LRCRSSTAMTWLRRSRRQLPTQRSATPFCQGLRNGSSHAGDLHGADRSGYFQPVLLVVIEEEELGNRVVRKGLAQLLHNPGTRGMASDVEVQNTASIMAEDEETVEYAESDCGNREEIHLHLDHNRRATTQNSLSNGPSRGLGCLRFNAVSCWRRARFSSIRFRRA
jgi:hypothetical protein